MGLQTKSEMPRDVVDVKMLEASDRLMTAAAVKMRCGGISDMSLWRWQKSETLNFPKPFKIEKVRYWSENQIEAWLETQRETED